MADIAVFVDDIERFSTLRYFIQLMIAEWRKAGHDVRICAGTRRPAKADLAILHIDSTLLSPDYLALADHYPTVVNQHAVDISKRRVSRQLVNLGDTCSGPVIVKTDANCGGASERAKRYGTPVLGRLRKKLDRRRHWTRTGILSSGNYPIYPTLDDVPAAVWSNPDLVVERFIEERHGSLYSLRQWVFFGQHELAKVSYSPHPVIKADNVVASEPIDEVPDSLRLLRSELGFDYGKFDYIQHDGEAVLLDANRTPTYGAGLGEKGLAYAAMLAAGIDAFLP